MIIGIKYFIINTVYHEQKNEVTFWIKKIIMMKNYRITVNGNTYDVQVEELNGAVAAKAPTVTQATPVATPAPVAAPAAAPAPANTGSEGSAKVTSPMPGNILDIKVNNS